MDSAMSTPGKNIHVMLQIFQSIEQRNANVQNAQRESALVQSDVETHWPPSLPYGGTSRGWKREGTTWASTWTPLQPTAAERRMDPRVIAASEDEVVILYHQRGLSPTGEQFDGEVLGLYRLRDGKLARLQMFYFDETAVVRFLTRARNQGSR